jgi:hypothetical protein
MDNGRFAHQHSCAAVRAAIKHLPEGMLYSDPHRDFRVYERKVC